MCSPTSVSFSTGHTCAACLTSHFQDGAACCIVVSEDFVHSHALENQAIEIVAQALTTDGVSTFEGRSAMDVVGYEMSKSCADKVFKEAGFAEGQGRDQVGVVELHDCFAANEVIHPFLHKSISPENILCFQLITYPALGLCAPGDAHKFVERGDNTVCTRKMLYSKIYILFNSMAGNT